MATFFVLPPRERLEQAVAEFVARVLPGLESSPGVSASLMAALELEANRTDDAYFVHREDLIGLSHLMTDLAIGFGAEPGDSVYEIGLSGAGKPAGVRRSAVPSRVSGGPAAR